MGILQKYDNSNLTQQERRKMARERETEREKENRNKLEFIYLGFLFNTERSTKHKIKKKVSRNSQEKIKNFNLIFKKT